MKPLGDKVVVKPESEQKKVGHIIIPDLAAERPLKGLVMFVGDGMDSHTMKVKPGDTVLYQKNAGTEIDHNGEILLIMRESDIFSIL